MPLKVLKVLEDKKNPLLERRELRLLVTQDAVTPKKEDVRKLLAEIEKVELDKVSIDHVYQKYGQRVSTVVAKIYDKPPAPTKKKAKKATEGDAAAKEGGSGEKK